MTFYARDLVMPSFVPTETKFFMTEENDTALEDNVATLMREWEKRYCSYTRHSILVSTFNVNGQPAPPHLPDWLKSTDQPPDLYVIGLQEMDLSQQAFIFDTSAREAEWLQLIRRMVGILLVLYLRTDIALKESAVEVAICPTGLLNRMGNKGGVAISLRLGDSTVCLVNAHLAAGTDELARRNQDYREIAKMLFPVSQRRIFDHDAVIWLGDLNYRLTTSSAINNEYIRQLCSSDAYLSLLKYDQLTMMQQKKSAFHDFIEQPITFRPTYKYDPGTNNWDSSEKVRVPSWCDRILYCCANAESLTPLKYMSINSVTLSDHKPVLALFELRVKHVEEKRRRMVHEEAVREADRKANEALPQISLSQNEFDFGTVRFFEASVQSLRIVNTGMNPVRFRFKPRPDGAISADWLTITPNVHQMKPGEECTVELCVLVDKAVAWKCPVDTQLQDILVVGLDHGRDHFLPVSAKYHKSCFGSSLIELLHIPPPVDLIDLGDGNDPSSSTCSEALTVPRQLWRLVSCLRRHLNQLQFLEQPASNKDFLALRNALDSGYPENLEDTHCSPFSMFETLLRLIDTFRETVIPETLHVECASVCDDATRCWQLVDRLPAPHRDLFQLMASFTAEVYASNAEAESAAIDAMVANVLFRTVEGVQSSHRNDRRVRLVRFFRSCVHSVGRRMMM